MTIMIRSAIYMNGFVFRGGIVVGAMLDKARNIEACGIDIDIVETLVHGLKIEFNCNEMRTKAAYWLLALIGENEEYRKRLLKYEIYMWVIESAADESNGMNDKDILKCAKMLLILCDDEKRKQKKWNIETYENLIFESIRLGLKCKCHAKFPLEIMEF